MDHYIILVFLSTLFMLSYLFSIISNKVKIPSVLLLIFSGISSNYLLNKINLHITIPFSSMQLVGTLGLILIVLDGSLDLNKQKEKVNLIISSLLFSIMMILILSITISIAISHYYNKPMVVSLINAVPLSIVSSAIVIPSVNLLPKSERDFSIYNSIFSDILGVLIFNFLVFYDITRFTHIIGFLASAILTLALSILFSIILIYILSNFKQDNRIIFILASVILLYSIGKLFHLSSLLLVFIFGLMLNNFSVFNKNHVLINYSPNGISKVLSEFRIIIGQFSFIIRTLFFFIFGFSIHMKSILNNNILFTGILGLILIYFFRYTLLKYVFEIDNLVQALIAPRGLITILLFYTIPQNYIIQAFDEGLILFFIILTNLIMVIGLQFNNSY